MRISGNVVRAAVKVVVSAGLLIFLLSKISTDDLLDLVKTLDRGVLAAAILVFFVSNLLGATQWHLLLRSSGVDLPFRRTFRFYFVGLFFNNFLPANIGGDAVKVYDVTRVGSSVYQVIAVTMLDRLIGIFSLCLLATVSVLYLWQSTPIESLSLYLLIFSTCMALPALFYLLEPLSRLLRWMIARIRPLSLDQRGASILDFMGKFKTRKPFVLRLVLLSTMIQSLRVMTHVLVAVSLGVEINAVVLALFFVFVPLLSLAMIPPITINGLGVREGLGIVLFSQAGIGSTDAFALEFLTYLISVFVSLLGFVFFVTRRGQETKASTSSGAN